MLGSNLLVSFPIVSSLFWFSCRLPYARSTNWAIELNTQPLPNAMEVEDMVADRELLALPSGFKVFQAYDTIFPTWCF